VAVRTTGGTRGAGSGGAWGGGGSGSRAGARAAESARRPPVPSSLAGGRAGRVSFGRGDSAAPAPYPSRSSEAGGSDRCEEGGRLSPQALQNRAGSGTAAPQEEQTTFGGPLGRAT
jgi:hypothetical protein